MIVSWGIEYIFRSVQELKDVKILTEPTQQTENLSRFNYTSGGVGMIRKDTVQFLLIGALFMSLTFFAGGCAKKTVMTDDEMKAAQAEKAAAARQGIGSEESLESKPWGSGPSRVLEGRTSAPMVPVYFDYDRSNIRQNQVARIQRNSELMKENTRATIRIEGNCDERGTNEYNMALGERRAMSAKKYMMNLGVSGNRIKTISYGEERPLNRGHDELSWSQNRRGDFVIAN